MEMKSSWCKRFVWHVLCAFVVVMMTGCEEDFENAGIDVTPASVSLSRESSVVLTAYGTEAREGLVAPLEWGVSDPSLGRIVASSGFTAVYRRSNADGMNVVVVRDKSGKEGYVVVKQRTDDAPVAMPESTQVDISI
jgi:hypothetical protein